MRSDRLVRVAAWVIVAFWTGSGAWALLAPQSFFDQLATFPPYNRHLIHDIGSMSLGLGATMALALLWTGTLRVVLTGLATAAVLHLGSHIVDRDLGGRDTDLPGLGLFAVVSVAAAIVASRGSR